MKKQTKRPCLGSRKGVKKGSYDFTVFTYTISFANVVFFNSARNYVYIHTHTFPG